MFNPVGRESFIMPFFSWQGIFGSLDKPKYVTVSILQWLCGYFNSLPSPWNMDLAKSTGPVLRLTTLCKNHFQYLSWWPAVFTRGPNAPGLWKPVALLLSNYGMPTVMFSRLLGCLKSWSHLIKMHRSCFIQYTCITPWSEVQFAFCTRLI